MKLEKCPLCSKKMRESNGRMVCPECGYYQVIDKNAASVSQANDFVPLQTPAGVSPGSNVPPSRGSNTPPQQPQMPPRMRPAVTAVSVHGKGGGIGAGSIALISIVAVLLLATVGITIAAVISSTKTTVSSPAASQEQETADYSANTARTIPESEFFCDLIQEIFGKDYTEISEQELSQITELSFYYDDDNNKCIYCIMADGTENGYYVDGSYYIDYADLSCFPGLTALSIEYGSVSPEDLSGLENLSYLASELTIAELCEAVSHPEKLETLQLYSTIFMDSCDGIENFPHLTALTIDCAYIDDISALTSLTELEMLALDDCAHMTDFSPLYDMNSLEALSIDSSALKDIGFVKNMPGLYYLYIKNAEELMSIEPLESCSGTMECLYLENTWKLSDFSVIEKLTGLTQLQLFVSYQDVLPSFAGLENLEYLSIHGAGDLRPLSDATGLNGLSLEDCNCEDLSVLSGMQNLEFLELLDMSGYFISLKPVTELPNLGYLDISGSTVYADAAPLLAIPTLQEFYMEDCNIGFLVENVSLNENLYLINMNNVTLSPIADPNAYGSLQDEEPISLSEHMDLFSNFPNLTELYLAGNELTDLSFIVDDGLTALQALDITDNYITDLSPLSGLPDLYMVNCTDNPIADTADLELNDAVTLIR